ncbi:hypothetical protein AFK68_15565 [Hydrocoleum sp. CS-953]|uniref:hypothetical protein n=1 Tax=Hydrocoleum sp. CS-953 TaxID=1671698 RepID=UPI000B9B8086|nr:hypothetical protein [Hydrocoleum sp. CS-953]OZH53751.1 hypothetical protein AFK68_15565 [Hydrocoleum sp. CS-953]
MGEFSLAQQYYQRQLAIAKKIDNYTSQGDVLFNLRLVYESMEDRIKVEELKQQQIAIAKELLSKQFSNNFTEIAQNVALNLTEDSAVSDLSVIDLQYTNFGRGATQ